MLNTHPNTIEYVPAFTTAAAWLTSMGFEKVASMAGGVVALGYR